MKETTEPLYRSCYSRMDYCPEQGGFWLTFGEIQIWL
ncbi:Zn-finger nucleic acid-binding protein [Spirosoma sp. LMG 31447]|uniref:Zn-finger nucleic acid-binding protein n=1 Tax=Spirosoma utsteinense TaxID=2585773 RepID=A0ABR6W8H2_9BACT|nr:Zn-finger nucleic acid-binding protein [Spirosoma utsteinense]